MIRIAKVMLAAGGAVVVLAIVALIGINLYLQSNDVQQRIRLATQDALGSPVDVKRTTYTPWGGLTLSGLTVPPPRKPAPNLLEASGFSVRFELLPLLSRRLVISEINVAKPVFALRQNSEGKWSIQPAPPDATVPDVVGDLATTAPVQVAPEAATDAQPVPETAGVHDPSDEGRPRAPVYAVELKKLRIRDGQMIFLNDRGRPVAVAKEVSVAADLKTPTAGGGTFRIAQLEFYEAIKPTDFVGTFSFADGALQITELTMALAKGKISGRVDADFPPRRKPFFRFHAEATGVSIPRLFEDATGESVGASGTVAAKLFMEGNPGKPDSITGNGRVLLDSARLQPMDFIRQVGSLLRIDELQMLDLEQAETDFAIRNKRVQIEHFVLKSDNLLIKGSGPVGFNGKMDIDARLLLNEKLQKQLRGVLLSENFTASEYADYQQVTFDITGKMSQPKTNLVERMTGIEIGSFGGLIRGLFQSPKRPSDADRGEAN